jgi:hypothetical protein
VPRFAVPSLVAPASLPCFASRMKQPSLYKSILPVVTFPPSCVVWASFSKQYRSFSASPVVGSGRGTPRMSHSSLRNESLFARSAPLLAAHRAMKSSMPVAGDGDAEGDSARARYGFAKHRTDRPCKPPRTPWKPAASSRFQCNSDT